MTRLVEVLSFGGCPHADAALALARRAVAGVGVDATLRPVEVPDAESAAATRFLGSPTIRVDGRDVEPGAEARGDCVLACRVYGSGEVGVRGEPEERWLREALTRS